MTELTRTEKEIVENVYAMFDNNDDVSTARLLVMTAEESSRQLGKTIDVSDVCDAIEPVEDNQR